MVGQQKEHELYLDGSSCESSFESWLLHELAIWCQDTWPFVAFYIFSPKYELMMMMMTMMGMMIRAMPKVVVGIKSLCEIV